MMEEPVIYTMQIVKDGEVLATKLVRTYLEGAIAATTPPDDELKQLQFAWMMRGKELCIDILHREGRWPPKTA